MANNKKNLGLVKDTIFTAAAVASSIASPGFDSSDLNRTGQAMANARGAEISQTVRGGSNGRLRNNPSGR
ncbi:UNVERIFIED_ORG: hypothetical protein EDC92_1434 [Dietzia maris]|uniref:hypothetical protein n=1 Tax=Dietzia maris TaxID=37915 RepID=UPI0010489C95